MAKWAKSIIYLICIATYTLFFLYLFQTEALGQLTQQDWTSIFLFFILLVLVASFPINIKGTNIVFLQAVTVAIFLNYGLAIEALLTQFSILYLLIRLKARELDRYVLNGTMLLLTSIGSAGVFYLLGGHDSTLLNITSTSVQIPVIPIAGYIISASLINYTLLRFIQNKIQNKQRSFFGKDFYWEIIPTMLITPTGVLIYILYNQIQNMAIIYVMIPVVSFSLIFRLYNKLDIVNDKLKIINSTGNIMTGKLNTNHVLEEFTQVIDKIVTYQYCCLYRLKDELQPVTLLGDRVTDDQLKAFLTQKIQVGAGLAGKVAATGRTICLNRVHKDLFSEEDPDFLKQQKSILALPLVINDQVIGILVIGHFLENHFSTEDETLIEILANQAAIALKNAEKYEETKRQTEIDELTGLYNYRYFEHLLFKMFRESQEKDFPLTLVILDIDHFKKYNDTYGHFAGNSVLRSLSQLLLEEVKGKGIVTRYGGEEFTILLPYMDEEAGYLWAEALRKTIEQSTFVIEKDLEDHHDQMGSEEEVQITVSLGVAVYPSHAEDPLNLIRQADRAMYTGAKRKGRNKVAIYDAG